MSSRKNFRADWRCPPKRAGWLAQNTQHIGPCWKRGIDEHLPPFATVDWETGGVEAAMQVRGIRPCQQRAQARLCDRVVTSAVVLFVRDALILADS